jgi:hypothetical protein
LKNLLPRKLNQRETILLSLIILSATVLSTRALGVKWRLQAQELDHKVSELSARKEKDRIEYEDRLNRSLASSQVLRSGEMISKIEENNDYFSTFVSKLAHQDGVGSFRILRLATDTPVQSPEYIRTPVTLTVESTFPAIGKFLESLENSPTLAEIDSMEIYRIESDLKKCSAKIKLSNYVVRK